jgi:nucleoside-diphosphate-sugar epimerase
MSCSRTLFDRRTIYFNKVRSTSILVFVCIESSDTSRLGIYRYADVMDIKQVQELLVNNQIDWLIHLSALLSAIGQSMSDRLSLFDMFRVCRASGEQNVPLAMKLNIEGTHHILELARKYKCRLFIPSTIGKFELKRSFVVVDRRRFRRIRT